MSRLQELVVYRNNIINALIQDQEIVKALYLHSADFLERSLPSDFKSSSLVHKQILPYNHIPFIESEPNTFITTKFLFLPYGSGEVIKASKVSFIITTHRDLLLTDYGLRTDFLVWKIDDLFNLSNGIMGFTKMQFNGMGDYDLSDPSGKWVSVYLSYKSKEFN